MAVGEAGFNAYDPGNAARSRHVVCRQEKLCHAILRFMKIDKTCLRRALQSRESSNWQPKLAQHSELVRPKRRPAELSGVGRMASVLILAYPVQDESHVVFTRRCEDLSKHPGQISFPGGRLESNEKPVDAAIREAHEEIGIVTEKVEPLGSLTSIYIPPSDFTVFPIVAWYDEPPHFVAQESEVAEVVEISFSHLLDPQTLRWGDIKVDEASLYVPYYRWRDHRIWGATAIMLSELLEHIQLVMAD